MLNHLLTLNRNLPDWVMEAGTEKVDVSAHYSPEFCSTISIYLQWRVCQIQFWERKMLPQHLDRSNFLNNKSHTTNHRVFESSLSAKTIQFSFPGPCLSCYMQLSITSPNTPTSIIPIWCLVTVCPLKTDSVQWNLSTEEVMSAKLQHMLTSVSTFTNRTAWLVRPAL